MPAIIIPLKINDALISDRILHSNVTNAIEFDVLDLKRPANLKDRVPYRQILLDPKMLVLLSACFFCGVSWSGLDPILEPELRSSVRQDSGGI